MLYLQKEFLILLMIDMIIYKTPFLVFLFFDKTLTIYIINLLLASRLSFLCGQYVKTFFGDI